MFSTKRFDTISPDGMNARKVQMRSDFSIKQSYCKNQFIKEKRDDEQAKYRSKRV